MLWYNFAISHRKVKLPLAQSCTCCTSWLIALDRNFGVLFPVPISKKYMTLSWLFVSFLAHVNIVHRIVSYQIRSLDADVAADCIPVLVSCCRVHRCHLGHPCLRAVLVARAFSGVLQLEDNYPQRPVDLSAVSALDSRFRGRVHGPCERQWPCERQ